MVVRRTIKNWSIRSYKIKKKKKEENDIFGPQLLRDPKLDHKTKIIPNLAPQKNLAMPFVEQH
jgi:hypothetical protein